MADTTKKTYLPSEMAAEILALSLGGGTSALDTTNLDEVTFGELDTPAMESLASKTGTTDPQWYENIAEAIRSLKAASTASYNAMDEGKVVQEGTFHPQSSLSVSENGQYDTTINNELNVSVPFSGILLSASDEGKVVQNGSLAQQAASTYSENGTYNTTTYGDVTINVPIAGINLSAADEGKFVQNGLLVAQTSYSVSENGVYDITPYRQMTVSVPVSGLQLSGSDEGKIIRFTDAQDGYLARQGSFYINENGVYNTISYSSTLIAVETEGFSVPESANGQVIVGGMLTSQMSTPFPIGANGTYDTQLYKSVSVSLFSGYRSVGALDTAASGCITFRYAKNDNNDIGEFLGREAYFPLMERVEHHYGQLKFEIPMCTAYLSSLNYGIKSIKMPYCRELASNAFAGDSDLEQVDFPVLSEIPERCFAGDYYLSKLSFPMCLKIGTWAFHGCSLLTAINFPNCREIATSAFYECPGITTLNFPNCREIATSAFYECPGITTLNLPACEFIHSSAFDGCSRITKIDLPNCYSIESGAFYNCGNISIISIGKAISFPSFLMKSVTGDFTTWMSSVTTIHMENLRIASAFGCPNLKYISFPNCERIEVGAFSGLSITSASFPKCTYIGGGAFYSCSSITSVYAPLCEEIGEGAFQRTNLISADFPNCRTIGDHVFDYCSGLKSISLPLIESVGSSFIWKCQQIETLYMPKVKSLVPWSETLGGLTEWHNPIGYWNIGLSRPLKTANIEGCEIIGSSVFQSCMAMTTIGSILRPTYVGDYAFDDCRSLTTPIDFGSCTEIGAAAFRQCMSMSATTLSLPVCSSIGGEAFKQWGQVESVYAPLLRNVLGFGRCHRLSSIYIPLCETIGANAFSETAFTSFSVSTCTTIGDNAFRACQDLETISFPECITIGQYAFSNCLKLRDVYFPKCEEIGPNAFTRCQELTTISLPACKYIDAQAFTYCSALTSVYLLGSTVVETLDPKTYATGSYLFAHTPLSTDSDFGFFGSIYVPASLYEAYRVAPCWSNYADRIVSVP